MQRYRSGERQHDQNPTARAKLIDRSGDVPVRREIVARGYQDEPEKCCHEERQRQREV